MKLCIISHAYMESGYLPTLASMAAYSGVQLTWISPDEFKGLKSTTGLVSVPGGTYRVYALPIRLPKRQGTFFYRRVPLEGALDQIQPDIILHEQEVFAMGAGQIARIASRRKIPTVIFASENLARDLAWPRRALMRYVFRHSAAIITVSRQAAERHRLFGYEGPIEVIAQIGPQMNMKPVFGLRQHNTFQISYAGRLVPEKGVDTLLRALRLLKARGINFRCTIVGQGPEADALRNLAVELEVNEQTHFSGVLPLAEVASMLRRSDVLVLPSRRTKRWEEQFGRILTEAMAEATVTVGSRTGAIPEVIGTDELTFEENDENMLASLLEKLARDPEFLQTQQRFVWKMAAEHFQSEVLTRRRIEFLESIACRTQGTRKDSRVRRLDAVPIRLSDSNQ